jgi:polysaccharide biosynthesis transport protein
MKSSTAIPTAEQGEPAKLSDDKTFDTFIQAFVSMLKRRRRLLLRIFLISMLGALIGAYVKRPYFESSASILIMLDTPSVSSSRSEVRRVVAQLEPDDVVASQVELIKTRQLAEELVDSLPESVFTKPPSSKWYIRLISGAVAGVSNTITATLQRLLLIENPPERYKRVKFIENGLSAFAVRKAQMMIVTFRAKDPEDPQIVLNKLIELYTQKVTGLRNSAEGYQLYTERALRLNDDLTSAEQALSQFKATHNVLDFETERQQLLARINSYSAVIDASPSEVKDVASQGGDSSVSATQRYFVAGPEAPAQIVQMTANLNALSVERARLLVTFAPGHPDVKRLQNQIEQIKSELEREVSRLARAKNVDQERLKVLLDIAPEYNKLARAVKIVTDSYEVYRKASEDQEATRERDLKVLTQVVDPPKKTYTPLPPTRLILVLAGLVFSLLLALAVGILTEWISVMLPKRRSVEAAIQ